MHQDQARTNNSVERDCFSEEHKPDDHLTKAFAGFGSPSARAGLAIVSQFVEKEGRGVGDLKTVLVVFEKSSRKVTVHRPAFRGFVKIAPCLAGSGQGRNPTGLMAKGHSI